MPKKTGHFDSFLSEAISFYRRNSDQIQKEYPRVLAALRTIEHTMYTVHPLRMCLWNQYERPILGPELSRLEDQYEKWFSDCDIDVTPARESLAELSQIHDHVSDLWLATSPRPTTRCADPHDALKAAQNSLEQSQSEEKITSYLYTMALLIHSSRKALEYLLHLFSLWVEIGQTHSGDLLRESDTRSEVTSCSTALYSAQTTWNELMRCPWTVACAIHLLRNPWAPTPPTNHRQKWVPAESMDVDEVKDKNMGNIHQILNSDRARPPKSAPVFAEVDLISVQSMLEACFRLDSVMRQQNEAQVVIRRASRRGTADSQSDEKIVHITFAPDKSKLRIDKTDVVQIIRDFWKKEALSNTESSAQNGFDSLSALADTPELSQHHLHMNLEAPKVHSECILAQHWIDNPRRINQTFPVMGVSHYACGTCAVFLQVVSEKVCEQSVIYLERMISGSRGVFCLCMVPEWSPPDIKEAVAKQLLYRLRTQLRDYGVHSFLRRRLNTYRRGSVGFNSRDDGVTKSLSGAPEDDEQMADI